MLTSCIWLHFVIHLSTVNNMYHALSILKLWCASWSKVFLNLWVVLMQMKIDPWMASFLRWLTGIRNWLRKLKGMDCQGNMQEWRTKNNYFLPSPGAYIRRGNLMEGFLYLEFEGLIHGGAYYRNIMQTWLQKIISVIERLRRTANKSFSGLHSPKWSFSIIWYVTLVFKPFSHLWKYNS